MRIYTFKKNNSFIDHYFKIYDPHGWKIMLTLIILFVLFVYSIWHSVPSNYLESLKEKYKLISVDRLFDYTVPLLSTLMVNLAFFQDYKIGTYEFLSYYHSDTFNRSILYRWLFVVIPFCIGTLISASVYYSHFFDLTGLLLSIRFLPNIFFLSALMLCSTVVAKNSYVGLFVTCLYFVLDLFSEGRFFKLFSIGANMNNVYYSISSQYYLLNRFLVCLAAVCFLFISVYHRRKKRKWV